MRESLARGVLGGYPVIDVAVKLTGGSYHELDSSEMAFRIAGSMGATAAAREAGPVLLEPVMEVEVLTPDEFMGEVTGNYRRAAAGFLVWKPGARHRQSAPRYPWPVCLAIPLTSVP